MGKKTTQDLMDSQLCDEWQGMCEAQGGKMPKT